MRKVKTVILAAGKGKRMKSDLPKVMHELRGKKIIDYVVTAVKKAGIKDVVMVVGHKQESFLGFADAGIKLVEQKELLGSGHALAQAESACQNTKHVLVLCGDVPLISPQTLKALLKKHFSLKAAATVLTGVMDNPSGYGRIIKDKQGKFVKIVEQKDATVKEKKVKEVNSGIYCFSKKDLFSTLKEVKRKNKQQEYYLTDVIEIFCRENKKVVTLKVKDYLEIKGINNRAELSLLDAAVQDRILHKLMEQGVTIIDPRTTFIGSGVKIGIDTIIMPFTVIEEDVKVGKGCKVGPFSHLRKGTILKAGVEIGNFVEVKKSTVGERTKAKHLSYIGDSLLGRKVNIGAGTITVNYDGQNKHQTIIGDGAFIGSDTKLVAPVKVGKKALTGAGSVVLEDVPKGSVVVGVPARKIR